MLISAFWHGVYSGYYLSMLTVPFILIAEDVARRKLRHLVITLLNYRTVHFFILVPPPPFRILPSSIFSRRS